jgi:small subunit ribosomal protein S5
MKKNQRTREEASAKDEARGDFEEKVLYINRCSTVTKGGRKFSFSALIVVGNGNGCVGLGFAKANEVSDAIRKGGEAARKNLMNFEREGTSIPHELTVSWDGCTVLLKPAAEGKGVIAGSKVRAVLELGGVKDVVAKIYGSNNPMNQVRAIFKVLASLKNRQKTLAARGLNQGGAV